MPIFVPKYLFRNVTRITVEFLQEQGIKGLVLDVDNTLTGHGSQELTPEIEQWLASMSRAGIRLMLASNNTNERVAPFAKKLGLHYASFCCKPSPRWIFEARRYFGLSSKQIALVGDQVFTDLLGGQLYGVNVLLVRPLYDSETLGVRMKRSIEKPFLLKYYKQGGRLL